MNREEAQEYAKTMSYKKAVLNCIHAKGIAYRKASLIKLQELAEIADKLERNNGMTKEEAIKRLKEYAKYSYCIWHNDEEDIKAFDIAIEALSVIDIVDLTNGNTITKAEYDGEPSEHICKECQFYPIYCQMGAPDGHWKACEGFAPKNELSAESSDLISKADVLGYIDRVTNSGLGKFKSLEYIRKYVENAERVSADRPTADEELQMWKDAQKLKDRITDLEEELLKYKSAGRPSGSWEHWGSPFSEDDIINTMVCTNCGMRFVEIKGETFYYCPHCGAKMENTK